MSEFPTLAEVISVGIDARLASMGKCLPGTVVSYNSTTETATVRPGVHQLLPNWVNDELDDVEELPALVEVPVAWFRARGISLVGDLSAGDPLLLFCCDRDISGWRRSGKPSEPDDGRVHSWSSAVGLPGVQADTGRFPVPTDAAALASLLDLVIKIVKGCPAGTDAGWGAFKTAITTAFPAVTAVTVPVTPPNVHTGLTTTGSARLKLDS